MPAKKGSTKKGGSSGVEVGELFQKFFPIQQKNIQEKQATVCTTIDSKLKLAKEEGILPIQLNAGSEEHLSDYQVWALTKALHLSEFRYVEGIRLWGCILGDLAIKQICEFVMEFQCVTCLELFNCKVSAKGCQYIGEALNARREEDPLHGPGVKFLRLDYNDFGDAGLRQLNVGLRMNANIDILSLGNCGITQQSSTSLLELLIFKESKLKDLSLEGNEILAEGAMTIFKAIQLNKSLLNLNIAENKIDENEEFVESFIETFIKNPKNPVENLNLSKNNINALTCNKLSQTLIGLEHNFQTITLPDKVDKDISARIGEFMKAKNKKKKAKRK